MDYTLSEQIKQYWNSTGIDTTGCPKKNSDPRLMGYRGHQKWTKDKSRVSFEKFRKFPFQ